MARIYEALKKAEELRAAAQGSELQPMTSFADAMPNFRIVPVVYSNNGITRGTADLAKTQPRLAEKTVEGTHTEARSSEFEKLRHTSSRGGCGAGSWG